MTRKNAAVFELLLTGRNRKEIASIVGISERALKFHVLRVYRWHGVQDRIELMAKFIRRDTNEKELGIQFRDARQREAEFTPSRR